MVNSEIYIYTFFFLLDFEVKFNVLPFWIVLPVILNVGFQTLKKIPSAMETRKIHCKHHYIEGLKTKVSCKI